MVTAEDIVVDALVENSFNFQNIVKQHQPYFKGYPALSRYPYVWGKRYLVGYTNMRMVPEVYLVDERGDSLNFPDIFELKIKDGAVEDAYAEMDLLLTEYAEYMERLFNEIESDIRDAPDRATAASRWNQLINKQVANHVPEGIVDGSETPVVVFDNAENFNISFTLAYNVEQWFLDGKGWMP